MKGEREDFFPALAYASAALAVVLPLSLKLASGQLSPAYAWAWSLFCGFIAFALSYTRDIAPWRRLFFVVSAFAFLVHFKFSLFSKIFEAQCFQDTPYCHIALAPSFLNYLYQQYLALMSGDWRVWGPLSLGFVWLFATIIVGRAWCSWTCFYGGLDEFFSRLSPVKKLPAAVQSWALRLRDFPMALLVFFMLISLSYMTPMFCYWLCPFKLGGEFLNEDGRRAFQLGLMWLALAFVVLLPLLTARRSFCSFLCPFGAWQSFWGRLNPFRVKFDEAACSGCGLCEAACPMFAIKKDGKGKIEVLDYCNMCAACFSACPKGGIGYYIFGVKAADPRFGWGRLLSPESLFIFSVLVFSSVFASLWAPAALSDLVRVFAGFF
ncbi:MAG: 4Fe-4S binding protein [Elusimicrobiales bacterium]|nr:4Fe-4S binding protein [Elusimicrobiales bacterium]